MTEGSATAARAPAVVVVLVTKDAGSWFDETLRAFAAQDYDNLSVLVLVCGGSTDPTSAVAAVLPDAFVRRLPEDHGFGAAVHEALSMVEGAPFFLLCHDDCAPSPDALHHMVEESFRANAGIVSPKMVRWDDPISLLHVGQSIDKTGAIVERVQDGEIDAGQHDAVRDVFVAPGGCALVRADLLRALDGYDPEIEGPGEDLDLSWRAHLAGARVVVAPAATVRHLELVRSGRRAPAQTDAPSLQALERRNELAAMLACYSRAHLLRILPQVLLLTIGELAAAAALGDRSRVRAVLHAWHWNLAHVAQIRRRRAAVQALRVLPDAEVRQLQVRGSARLSDFFSGLATHGLDAARGWRGSSEPGSGELASGELASGEPVPGGVLAVATNGGGQPRRSARIGFAEDADFDELDDLGRRSRDRLHRSGRLFATRRARLAAWLVAVGVLAIGSRHLLGGPLPLVGQFLPFPSWTSAWQHVFASWEPTGFGTAAPASPAFAALAVLGTAVFGQMGLLQELLVLGCVPVGVWGVSRLLGSFGSAWARFVGALSYVALPLVYDAVARGSWDGLVAYAATPWIVDVLARSTRLAPFDVDASDAPGGWRRTLWGRMVALGAIEALAMSFAPATAIVVACCALGIAGGSLVAGGSRAASRALLVAAGATFVACVLCAPWVIGTLGGGGAVSVFGLAGGTATAPGWGGLLRLAVGPFGGSPLAWLLLAAAFAPLLVARDVRLAWAVRLWAVLLVSALVAIVSARALAGSFAPALDVVLAPVALSIASCVGIGVAAFEHDLSGYRFGWRQVVAPVAVGAIALGMLPAVAAAGSGRWDLPVTGYTGAAQLPPAGAHSAPYRVLWIGNPDALPSGGWSIGTGLAYATTIDGTPQLGDLWPQASPGRTRVLAHGVEIAMRGETVDLGKLLSRYDVRDVVVIRALAPQTPGVSSAPTVEIPSGLVASLARQVDLRTVPLSVGGLVEFQNTAYDAATARQLRQSAAGGPAGVLDPLGGALELVLWAALAAAVLGRRRWLDRWWARLRRGRRMQRRPREGVPVLVPRPEAATPHLAPPVVTVADPAVPSPTPAGGTR